MMQSSTELKELILQLYEKEASGESFDFARQLYSSQENVLLIGSEPDDRYEGYQEIIRFYKMAGASGVEIQMNEIQAHVESLVGWVVDRVTARLPDGLEVSVRHTYIFHREEDAWRVVHAHISVGIPDKDLGRIFISGLRKGSA